MANSHRLCFGGSPPPYLWLQRVYYPNPPGGGVSVVGRYPPGVVELPGGEQVAVQPPITPASWAPIRSGYTWNCFANALGLGPGELLDTPSGGDGPIPPGTPVTGRPPGTVPEGPDELPPGDCGAWIGPSDFQIVLDHSGIYKDDPEETCTMIPDNDCIVSVVYQYSLKVDSSGTPIQPTEFDYDKAAPLHAAKSNANGTWDTKNGAGPRNENASWEEAFADYVAAPGTYIVCYKKVDCP